MLPQPSLESLASSCRKQGRVAGALRLQAYSAQRGLQAHLSVGNDLVCLLAQVGLLCLAQNVFNRLPFRSVLSWTSLIDGFLDHDEDPTRAFSLYHQMRSAYLCPPTQTLVSLLQASAKLNDLQSGREIHVHIVEKDLLKANVFLGNALINMYGSCGSLEMARELFESLPLRNTITWNILIARYVQHDHSAKALQYFEKMQLQGILPDSVTFTCIIKACASMRAIDKGNEIYEQIVEKGLLINNFFIGSALVDMFAKCGLLAKAQEVFDVLQVRNVVTWTTLVAGYVQHGHGNEALKCFEQMQVQGVDPNAVTYASALKACSIARLVDKGVEIHAEIARKGMLNIEISVGNALVDMYASLGLLTEAREVFTMLPRRNLVTWNTLLTGHMLNEQFNKVLDIFEEMQLQGVSPDGITISFALKACGSIGDVDKGSELHTEVSKMGHLSMDLFVGNALVEMYANCGSFAKAKEVFEMLPARDVATWNSLILGLIRHKQYNEALISFEQMQAYGVNPDSASFAGAARACGGIGDIKKGKRIHDEITKRGLLQIDPFIGTALVDMYAKLGLLSSAREVFDSLPARNVFIWTSLIAGYTQHDEGAEALKCLECMEREGISPNAHTFSCSLKACGGIGALERGREIHIKINRMKSLKENIVVGSALVDMYTKCGYLLKAQEVFDTLPVRNKVTWNAIITGYAQLGDINNVMRIFDDMERKEMSPDSTTFLSVLSACSHAGIIDDALLIIEIMIRGFDVIPALSHYTCLVDLLGRAGQLEGAFTVLQETPFNADMAMWLAILSSCQKSGDMVNGRWAFQQAVHLDDEEASVYICMSNMYVDSHIQGDVLQVSQQNHRDCNRYKSMRCQPSLHKHTLSSISRFAGFQKLNSFM